MASATYRILIDAAEAYLMRTGSTSPENSKSNKQIISDLKIRILNGELNVDATDGTMLSYLSQAARNDPDSSIVSGGPHGGYWYDSLKNKNEEKKVIEEQKLKAKEGKDVKVIERDLYPLMELWLQQKGYKSKDMSNLKSGGIWGNPDIIGAERVDLFGAVQVDLASCEVKLGINNWEQVIFEAISHKRFSNRSWFCYRINSKDEPMPKGMEYYAERYRVGVVQIVLTDQEFLDLKSGSKQPLDFIENVVERIPALYDYVPLREQRDLIERTGISLTLTF